MKLIIDWSKVSSEFKWAAMDGNGEVWIYTEKPKEEARVFMPATNLGQAALIETRSYSPNWGDTLTERPEEPTVKQPEQPTAKPHKHAALIAEWIKDTSRVVEFRVGKNDHWKKNGATPAWGEHAEYRFADTVKPEITSPLTDDELRDLWHQTKTAIDTDHDNARRAIAIAAKVATLKEVAAMPSETNLDCSGGGFSAAMMQKFGNACIAEFQKHLLKQLG